MSTEEYFYFIDEAGDLNPIGKDTSKSFCLTCTIIDNLEETRKKIIKLEKELNDSAFFNEYKTNKFFHASKDHLAIYGRYVELLNNLNFRAYAVVLNKKSALFKKLSGKNTKKEIYNDMIFKLMYDRLLKRKDAKNFLFFEGESNKRGKEKEEKEAVILKISDVFKQKGYTRYNLNFELQIKDKGDELISVVDYTANIISRIFEGKRGDKGKKDKPPEVYMKKNFKLIEPKIALIRDVAENKFYKLRTDSFDIQNFFIK